MDRGIHPHYRIFYSLSMAFCTKSAVRSIEVLNDVFEHFANADTPDTEKDIDVQSMLDELQNVVVQGAAVARYFWPIRDNQQIHANRAEALRKEFGITDDNPLRVCKPLRDAMEHFDERLDKYLARGVVGHIFPITLVTTVRGMGCRCIFSVHTSLIRASSKCLANDSRLNLLPTNSSD